MNQVSDNPRNWVEIKAFDATHLMTVTEYNEVGGSETSTTVASYGFDTSPRYRKDDVDARIKFYKQYFLFSELPETSWVYSVWNGQETYAYPYWLFVFCFGDMNENFMKKVSELEKKQ
jgi:hypothetical protein